MQKKLVVLVLAALALSATPAYAIQGNDNNSDNKGPRMERAEKDVLIENRNAFKEEMKANRRELKAQIQQYKLERKELMSSKSAEMKATMDAKKEEFKAKIAAIKDSKKKITAERVDEKLALINTKQTDVMSKAVVRLQELLNKFIDRTNAAKGTGVDTSEVEAAIANAKTALSAAEASIAAQKAKTYTADVTDETSVGKAFSTELKQLRSDLKVTHDSVKAAKKAVREVAMELMKVSADVTPSQPTEEPTPTP